MSAKRAPNQMSGTKPEARRPKDDPKPAAGEAAGSKKSLVKTIIMAIVAVLLIAALWKKFNPAPPTPLPRKQPEAETAWTSAIDGERTMDQVKRFVAVGPRVAGTPGSLQAQAMIKAELGAAGITEIREQKFTDKTPEGPCSMVNLVGVLPGKQREGIALSAHYDSKPIKGITFIGANDAASAVGVLFELARKLKAGAAERELTYYFVFFDGEEAFNFDWGNQDNGAPDNTYGSRYFALKMDEENYPIKALINLDMIGDKDYSLKDDSASSPELMAIFKKASKSAFGTDFFVQPGGATDDHISFKEKIPVIDLIDFEYGPNGGLGYWHTQEDTLDKLSVRSLERTGTLVLKALPDVEAMVLKTLRAGVTPKKPEPVPPKPDVDTQPATKPK